MAKEVMRRRAADNEYLHKDFHAAFNFGLEYVRERFGDEAVRDYLRRFARAFYAPLTQALKDRGLAALREHFERIYAVEGAAIEIVCGSDELTLRVAACPAVAHVRKLGHEVSPLFVETTRVVNEAVCEGTPFAFELAEYDAPTGRSVQRFRRRASA